MSTTLLSQLKHHTRTLPHLLQTHAHLLRFGHLSDHRHLNVLLTSYFRHSLPDHATVLFDSIPSPSLPLFNALLRGLSSSPTHLTRCYLSMCRRGLSPDDFTFPFVLKACAAIGDQNLGKSVHTHVVKFGFEGNVFVSTGLVGVYARCGALRDALRVFEEMPVRNIVTWTVLIVGFLDEGRFGEGLGLFRMCLQSGMRLDSFVVVRVLTGCCRLGDLETGEWVRRYVDEVGLGRNVFVASAIVDMYAKFGCMEKARCVFDGMVERDEVTWNIMVGGYSSNGMPKEALEMFSRMKEIGIRPDCYTMVGVFSACSRLGALEFGEAVSSLIESDDLVLNPVLGTALVDMYVKCGSIGQAWVVFKDMRERDIVVWNAIISGLAMSGYGQLCFSLFAQIEKLGMKPSGNTFVGLLCSCTHTGLVEEGRRYFDSMTEVYSLIPRIEHYGCFVDLLGRAGLLEEAHQLIKEMPMEANAVVWGSLLSGCRMHRNINLAEHVLNRLIVLEPHNSGNYVLLANLYSSAGRYEDSAKLRLAMKDQTIKKIPGCSWIEVNGTIHEFLVGDCSHPLSEKIYLKLIELKRELKIHGYSPTTEVVLFDIEEEEKEDSLGEHSEKLAVAFGLVSLPASDPIRVVKNLRICRDCHTAIKLISKITGREIIIRDNNRFHGFKDGSCSCNDYW